MIIVLEMQAKLQVPLSFLFAEKGSIMVKLTSQSIIFIACVCGILLISLVSLSCLWKVISCKVNILYFLKSASTRKVLVICLLGSVVAFLALVIYSKIYSSYRISSLCSTIENSSQITVQCRYLKGESQLPEGGIIVTEVFLVDDRESLFSIAKSVREARYKLFISARWALSYSEPIYVYTHGADVEQKTLLFSIMGDSVLIGGNPIFLYDALDGALKEDVFKLLGIEG